jgi:hypothetical protein
MWKEVVLIFLEVLSCHSHGGTEEEHENIEEDSRCTVRDSSQLPPKYKAKLYHLSQLTHRITVAYLLPHNLSNVTTYCGIFVENVSLLG